MLFSFLAILRLNIPGKDESLIAVLVFARLIRVVKELTIK